MSPKPGRPVSGVDKRDITVRLRMEPDEVKELDTYAEILRTTRSGAIREGLKLLKKKLAKE